MMQTVTISLPETVYRRLQHAAEIAGKPITEIAAQSIQESLPPLLEAIPARFRADLQTMQQFADDELWRIARSVVVPKDQRRYRRLLTKNSSAALSLRERQTLTELRATADKIMLQKAYAYLLLKWRGYRISTLTELESKARVRVIFPFSILELKHGTNTSSGTATALKLLDSPLLAALLLRHCGSTMKRSSPPG